jgi:predicted ribosome quality control (RQC) complex YloA/Tae2 family protein
MWQWEARREEIDSSLQFAVNGTMEASARLDSALEALRRAEEVKETQLSLLVAKLAKQDGGDSAAAAAIAATGRKGAIGRDKEPGSATSGSATSGSATSGSPAAVAVDGLNITEIAKVAEDAAEGVMQSVKASVELKMAGKSSEVTSRAVEIAQELTGGTAAVVATSGNMTSAAAVSKLNETAAGEGDVPLEVPFRANGSTKPS